MESSLTQLTPLLCLMIKQLLPTVVTLGLDCLQLVTMLELVLEQMLVLENGLELLRFVNVSKVIH